MAKKNTFLKVIGVFLLIQGALQLLNVVMVLTSGTKMTVSPGFYYVSLILLTLYGIVALAGGITALKHGREYTGCQHCFAYGLILIALNVLMMILNMMLKVFDSSQLGAFLIPGLFTIAAVFGGRSK